MPRAALPPLLLLAALPAQDPTMPARRPSGPIEQRVGLEHWPEEMAVAWEGKDWQAVVAFADAQIRRAATDHRGHTLKYLALLELRSDRGMARLCATRAKEALAGEPLQLVEFIDRGLYTDPETEDFQLALMALVPVLPAARHSVRVRIAHLRAVDACSTAKEAAAMTRTVVEDLDGRKDALWDLVRTIVDMRNAKAMAPTATKALDLVIGDREPELEHLLVRYRIVRDLLGEHERARVLGAQIIQRSSPEDLNGLCWNLMVAPATAGKYDALALQVAEVLEKSTTQQRYEIDTIALAYFRNGQVDKAIRLQRHALELAQEQGDRNPGYRERLDIYIAAQRARPPRESATSRTEDRGELVDGIRVGEWTHLWDDGSVRAKGRYEAGSRTGEWTFWNRAGWLEERKTFVRGKIEGEAITWSWDATVGKPYKARIDRYVDGERHGVCLAYYPNGKLRDRETFQGGTCDGPVEHFREDGSPRSKGVRYGNVKHGNWEFFEVGPDGKPYLSKVASYRVGRAHGKCTDHYPDGAVWKQGTFANGEPEGQWKEFHPGGQLKRTGELCNGKWHGRNTVYHPDGWIEVEADFREGKIHGSWTSWRWSPTKRERVKDREGQSIDDLGTGVWRFYHNDGSLECTGVLALGRRDGEWKGYHPGGGLAWVERWADGQPSGEWKAWHPNGQLREEGEYAAGKRTGTWTLWHENGQKAATGRYEKAEKVGSWSYWDRDGRAQRGG